MVVRSSILPQAIGELGDFAVSVEVHNFQRSDLLGLTRTLAGNGRLSGRNGAHGAQREAKGKTPLDWSAEHCPDSAGGL
jgi:hypothetical protein